jgi:hypothetical protein
VKPEASPVVVAEVVVAEPVAAAPVDGPAPVAVAEAESDPAPAPEVVADVITQAPAPVAPPLAAKTKAKPARKSKPVRDSFTFPEEDYALLGLLKKRALGSGCEIKKSELLRAGLQLLNRLDDTALLQALNQVERVKTGRPRK